MEISFVSTLIVVALCGLVSGLAAYWSDDLYTEKMGWLGNIVLVLALAACIAVSLFSPGVALISVLVCAAVSGYKSASGLEETTPEGGLLIKTVSFVALPILSIAATLLLLSAVYVVIVFVFSHFPLPFTLEYSVVPAVFRWMFTPAFRVWEYYATWAYFSISTATALVTLRSELIDLFKAQEPIADDPGKTPPATTTIE
ncbi:MAG TPA: hypothetical protein V6C81_12370 [Planktothrix sp.]|jgi:hypothetical protein